MRITGGGLAGKSLKAVFPEQVKPTTDMVREALFMKLEQELRLNGLQVLDLFSGSGIVSLEFLSRGCSVLSVDADRRNLQLWQRVQRDWNLESWAMRCADVIRLLPQLPADTYHIVFADPPYDLSGIQSLPASVFRLLKPGGLFILEHRPDILFPAPAPQETRQYGRSCLSFFKKEKACG